MSETSRSAGSLSPDDALPPVEPPSAGFLVQLFVIPGVIVAIIVMVWLLFHWLAHMGNDPRQYVDKLRGSAETRWQAAVNLAGSMNGQAGDEIKGDAKIAADLSSILDNEVKAGSMEEGPIRMRRFLCQALGRFRIDVPMPALINAAKTQRDEKEIDVQRDAVQGLAVLISTLHDSSLPAKFPELVPTLIDATKSSHDSLRTEAAFALCQVDDPAAIERLKVMLDDPYPNARFNAAGCFARRGDEAALPVILEMLDPEQKLAIKDEAEAAYNVKRMLVNVNGLKNLLELNKAKPGLDLTAAKKAVDELTHSKLREVRDYALKAQRELKEQKAEAVAP
jgi:hypothetical protein